MNVTAIAAAGMARATQRFEASAQRTANLATPGSNVDVASEVVEHAQAKTAFSANLKVLKTADEMMGELLDLKI